MNKCPLCQGTGFKDGKICICIKNVSPGSTFSDQDIMDFLGGFSAKNLDKSK
jgi:hypothetical protein